MTAAPSASPLSARHGRRARGLRILAMLSGLAVAASFPAKAQEVLILVRHAEKLDASRDTPISPDGVTRAQALADKLRDAGITSIWTSEFRRTQETAKPLADALGLKPHVHPANDSKGLVEALRKAGGRAVVVGHSNTLPEIAKLYGAKLEQPRDDDYGGLYLIAKGVLVKLRQ
ncbi:MAG TPA: phosphoglycerate mutase family protein [Myxococcales bacterium]|jgi:phosphohistidine phosphatase SixA